MTSATPPEGRRAAPDPATGRPLDAGSASSQATPVRVAAAPLVLRTAPAEVGASGQVWWDDQVPSARWNTPSWVDAFSRRTKVWSVVALVALVIGALIAAGGLKEGGLRFTTLASDAVVRSGPFELTFIDAVFRKTEYANAGEPGWELLVRGTCRNIDTTSRRSISFTLAETVLIGTFQHGDPVLTSRTRVYLGTWDGRNGLDRNELAPGIGPVPCSFQGALPIETVPETPVFVGVHDLVWNDGDLGTEGGQTWMQRDTGVRLRVPAVIQASE